MVTRGISIVFFISAPRIGLGTLCFSPKAETTDRCSTAIVMANSLLVAALQPSRAYEGGARAAGVR
jgi:hypothetical protein